MQRFDASSLTAAHTLPRRNRLVRYCLATFLVAIAPTLCAASLDPALQRKIQSATFEVVIAKPIDDPLTYEKPLPLDLLPFQYRNDKFRSIGTAFAIGGGHYVTAGHVFAAALDGSTNAPALRDGSGHVYALGQVEKYSAHEDFVVFTLASQPVDAVALEINTKPVLNETVYSVGNAFGEGVVIRDGLYTSDTPENQDGRWKWLRFSAAASPGNSGGPLLDASGKVIGVVVMKSPSENLNIALPIAQLMQAPDHLARIDTRGEFRLDIFDKTKTLPFKQEFALPKSFPDFAASYFKLREEFNARGRRELLADNAQDIFPNGAGSNKLLHTTYEKVLPALITRGENEIWGLDTPRYSRVDIGSGGSLDVARLKSEQFLHLRKPENVDAGKLHTDAVLYNQLVLKGSPLYRQVGSEKIKITSLGRPTQDTTFSDRWGRSWQVRTWPMDFQNGLLVSLDLPVPEGYVSMRRLMFAGFREEQLAQMKILADFVAVSYGGSLAQWQDFMHDKNAVSPALAAAKIQFDYAKSFDYRSPQMSFSYTPELQKIDKDNRLTIDFGFLGQAEKTSLVIAGVALHEDAEGKTEVGVFRHSAPSEDLDESFQKNWSKRLQHKHPYDAVAFEEDSMQYIRAIYGEADQVPPPKVVYTFLYRAESGTSQEQMKSKLDLLMKNAHVEEH
jgi:serine protease Do